MSKPRNLEPSLNLLKNKSELMDAYIPDMEELNYLVAAVLATGAAFTAFHGALDISGALFYTFIGLSVILVRELGQRTIAQWMKAETELHLSLEGSILTVLGAAASVLTQLPIILLFPVHNSFSITKYEHWGRQIDAMWSKREYQIVSGGIVALLLAWLVSFQLGYAAAANAFALFALFQLLPFDYKKIPTGRLDGSIILRVNSFRWLVFFALTLLALALV